MQCDWFLQAVYYVEVDLQLVFVCDDVWFSLSWEANSQNWYSSAENPGLIYPIRDANNGVWCAMSAHGIIRPIFCEEIFNLVMYTLNILRPFISELTEVEKLYGCSGKILQQLMCTARVCQWPSNYPWSVVPTFPWFNKPWLLFVWKFPRKTCVIQIATPWKN
jgi:hypothetical protein